jgi:hypothetical protein
MPREEGIALFDASGKPIAGDITSQILLWDAGTEVNEEPGLGPNQAPLQPAPNTGPAEHGVVRPISEVKDGFDYPSVAEVLRVTITPGPTAMQPARHATSLPVLSFVKFPLTFGPAV